MADKSRVFIHPNTYHSKREAAAVHGSTEGGSGGGDDAGCPSGIGSMKSSSSSPEGVLSSSESSSPMIENKKNIQDALSDIDTVQLSRIPSLDMDTIWDSLLVSDS
ncbi:ethylene-responsive transcription factor ERF062 [Olea europaea subsp. europaea]|uniref:Ethylene-responsive transcription factor ERF062 n=1 Tax=Olea europaea subsp. europaea TaxID=158383 RepID=A0A8S0V9P7_OLEEU|nr:ethylene-responsive transcription factor ERF062 [Olea europaea subsp. europaea]